MKNLFTLLTVVLLTCSAQAQSSVTGKILGENNEPAVFVTLMLMTPDSTMAKGAVTDVEGKFQFIGIQSGEYRIVAQSVEFAPYSTDFFDLADGENKTIPNFTLNNVARELNEVQVTASRPMIQVEPDKTVFNVEQSPNASGSDGMELLRKSPGVTIDNNDNIILQGKNGVIIYVDDKPVRLDGDDLTAMLRGMQSDQIESIEIITNPSSKYDAQGNAGIINIKLKRDKNLGTNATLTGGYNIGIQERYRGGITMNHRDKKFSAFGNYNYYKNSGWNFIDLYREQNGGYFDQYNESVWNVEGHGFRIGADFYATPKSTVGFVVNGYLNDNSDKDDSRSNIGAIGASTIDSVLVANNRDSRHTDNINVNLNYRLKGEKGQSFSLDLDYGYYNNNSENLQPNKYEEPETGTVLDQRNFVNINDTEIDIMTAKADYEFNLGKGRFSTGAKISSVITYNSFEQYREEDLSVPEDRSDIFEYTEVVSAAYTNYYIKVGEKWAFNGGIRLERTYSKGDLASDSEPVERTYTNLFPSGGFTYSANKNNQYGINYSRRLNRPSYQDLNPFEFQLDELTFRKGNPFLTPQYTHSIQATHTWKSMINTRLSYSYTSDFFAQVIEQSEVNDQATQLRQQNLATSEVYGLNVSAPIDIKKWWSTYASLSVNTSNYTSDLIDGALDVSITTFNGYIQNNFVLPKGYRLEVSGWYNSPSIWGGTFLTSEMYSVDLGIQKAILKGQGNLTVGVSDVFLSQRWTGDSDVNDVLLDIRGGNDSRRFKVGFTYRIGNQQVRLRKRSTGLEDEASRIKSED